MKINMSVMSFRLYSENT